MEVLNQDTWMPLLEFVSIPELVKCELVSKSWCAALSALPVAFWRRRWSELSSEDLHFPPPITENHASWRHVDQKYASLLPPSTISLSRLTLSLGHAMLREDVRQKKAAFLAARFGLDRWVLQQPRDFKFSSKCTYEACRAGHANLLPLLPLDCAKDTVFGDYENRIFPDGFGQRFDPFSLAVANRQIGAARRLLELKADPNFMQCRRRPLQQAAEDGWLEGVELLLAANADVNECQVLPRHSFPSPFYLAMSKDHLQVAQLLLRHGANPSYVWQPYYKYARTQVAPHNALSLACSEARTESVKFLLELKHPTTSSTSTTDDASPYVYSLTSPIANLIPSHSCSTPVTSILQRSAGTSPDEGRGTLAPFCPEVLELLRAALEQRS